MKKLFSIFLVLALLFSISLFTLSARKRQGKDRGRFFVFKTAGEVEARDTARRLNLNSEQRKNTRPDIDRTDVVFANNSNVGYSVAKPEEILYNNDSPLSITDRASTKNNSSIKWVYDAQIFSVTENKKIHQKISELNQGSKSFSKTANDEYMIPIENKLIFTDGNYNSPYISEVVEVLTDSATEFEVIKETIYNVEKGKLDKSEEVRTLKAMFGDGIIVSYKSGNDGVYDWQNGKRKGKSRSTVIRNYLNKQYRRGNDNQSKEIEINSTDPITKESSTDDSFFDASKKDAKMSLSNTNEDITPVRNGNIYGEDIKLQPASAEDIAPIGENVVRKTTQTESDIKKQTSSEIDLFVKHNKTVETRQTETPEDAVPVEQSAETTETVEEKPKSKRLERVIRKIDTQLEQDKADLSEDFQQKKTELEKALENKTTYKKDRGRFLVFE